MSVPLSVDPEAGPVSDQRLAEAKLVLPDDEVLGVGSTGCQSDPSPRNPESVDVTTAPGFGGDASEKIREVYVTRSESEPHVDAVFGSWEGSSESILFAVLFSTTVSLFIVENYGKLSPDVTDHAIALFYQISQPLVGTSGDTSPDPSPPLSLDAALFQPSTSVLRTITMWFLSLSLNLAYALWILGQQWWRQDLDVFGQSGASHNPARMPRYLPSWAEHFAVLLFVVSLVDFILYINKTIAWIVLGYLTPFVFLYVATTLLPCHLPGSRHCTLFPNQA